MKYVYPSRKDILYLYTVSLIDRTAADLGSWVVACDYQMLCL